ncbi:hypothetical protein NKH77_46020 [Streptomyces sp. M19]
MGLFRRAIVQSGSGLGAFTPSRPRASPPPRPGAGRRARADAFADVPDERLVEAASGLAGIDLRTATHSDPLIGLSPFGLVLDEQPAVSVAAGLGAGAAPGRPADRDQHRGGNLYLVPGAGTPPRPPPTSTRRRPARTGPGAARRGVPSGAAGASSGELRSAIMGDALFGAGSRALADAHAAHAGSATFGYAFAWRSPPWTGGSAPPTRWNSLRLRPRGPARPARAEGLLGPDAPRPTSPRGCTARGSGSPGPGTRLGPVRHRAPGHDADRRGVDADGGPAGAELRAWR